MALKTLVKVGEITNLSDARYCAGMGVEMLGFNLDPDSDSYVSSEQFKEITEWVAGVKFVGECGKLSKEAIQGSIPAYNLDFVELHHSNGEVIFDIDLPSILTIDSLDETLLQRFHNHTAYFLLNIIPTDWTALDLDYSLLVGEGIDLSSLEAIMSNGATGIALKGSHEEKPGFKDYDQLADILEALETED